MRLQRRGVQREDEGESSSDNEELFLPQGGESSDGAGNPQQRQKEGSSVPPTAPFSPFRWRSVVILLLVVSCESMSLTILAPMLPEMVDHVFGVQEANVGIVVGVLVGLPSLFHFFSSFAIGHLTDSCGRKVWLALGMFIVSVTTFLFGLSQELWQAVLLMMINGAFTANLAVSKAALSDITAGYQRARVFGLLGASFGLTRAVSSGLGGLLTGFEVLGSKYTTVCLVVSSYTLIVLVLQLLCLRETLPKEVRQRIAEHHKAEERSRLAQSADSAVEMQDMSTEGRRSGKDDDQHLVEHGQGSSPVRSCMACASTGRCVRQLWRGVKLSMSDPVLRKLMTMNCMVSWGNGALLTALTLFMAQSVETRGLGFSPLWIGMAFLVFGLSAFFFQIFFFGRMIRKVGLRQTTRVGMLLLGSSCVAIPVCTLPYVLEAPRFLVISGWILAFIFCCSLGAGFMLGLPLVQTMISNAADPTRQGIVQGTAQSLNSLLRSLGPIFVGMFTVLGVKLKAPWIVFLVISSVYFSSLLFRFPEKVEGTRRQGSVDKDKKEPVASSSDGNGTTPPSPESSSPSASASASASESASISPSPSLSPASPLPDGDRAV